jgi:hypothetical protein
MAKRARICAGTPEAPGCLNVQEPAGGPPSGITGTVITTTGLMLGMLQAMLGWFLSLFASLSDFTESGIAEAYGNNTAYQIGQQYTKLHIGDPGETGVNNAAGETTRKSTSFGTNSGGVLTTDADITWTNVASSETLSYVSQWDAATVGNCSGSGPLGASKIVTAGDTFLIASGSLTVTFT